MDPQVSGRVPYQVYTNRIAVWFYVLGPVVAIVVGSIVARALLRLPWPLTVAAGSAFVLVGLIAFGQNLFTRVEVRNDSVCLKSPFRRVTLRRSEIVSLDLWQKTSEEESKPLLRQAAVLYLELRRGKKMAVSMMDIRILRAIAAQLRPLQGHDTNAHTQRPVS